MERCPKPESTSTATGDDLYWYTNGMCHIFAIALARKYGWGLMVAVDPDTIIWANPDDDDDVILSVLHVYAVDGSGNMWDVAGVRSREQVSSELEEWLETDFFLVEMDEGDLVEQYVDRPGDDVDRPLDAFTQAELDEADRVVDKVLANLISEHVSRAPAIR